MKTIRTWAWIGLAEGLLVLGLAAIAPHFINSPFPIIGFFIWFIIIGLMGGSIGYILWRLRDAYLARIIFINSFPIYRYLGMTSFLDYSSSRVQKMIKLWEIIHDEPEFKSLNMSPLEFLLGHKHDDSSTRKQEN
ncbi:MAG: hypothetical protein AAGD25_21425 [Cyanobacteria bacterium P01_F01_bin.150]